jgi:hypothetical protein
MPAEPVQSDSQPKEKDRSVGGESIDGLLSILTPEVHPDDNQTLPKPRKKIKRKLWEADVACNIIHRISLYKPKTASLHAYFCCLFAKNGLYS